MSGCVVFDIRGGGGRVALATASLLILDCIVGDFPGAMNTMQLVSSCKQKSMPLVNIEDLKI